MGGYSEKGSSAAFMLAIVLLGGSMILLWMAFHTPADWEAYGGNFPGLIGRIMGWMDRSATGAGGLAGSGNPFTGASGVTQKVVPDTGLGAQVGAAANPFGPAPTYPTPTGAPPPDQWQPFYSTTQGWRGAPPDGNPSPSGNAGPTGTGTVQGRF
jgi:hypothetical protein